MEDRAAPKEPIYWDWLVSIEPPQEIQAPNKPSNLWPKAVRFEEWPLKKRFLGVQDFQQLGGHTLHTPLHVGSFEDSAFGPKLMAAIGFEKHLLEICCAAICAPPIPEKLSLPYWPGCTRLHLQTVLI